MVQVKRQCDEMAFGRFLDFASTCFVERYPVYICLVFPVECNCLASGVYNQLSSIMFIRETDDEGAEVRLAPRDVVI